MVAFYFKGYLFGNLANFGVYMSPGVETNDPEFLL